MATMERTGPQARFKTFAGLVPVIEVDGRKIGQGERGPVTERLQGLYRALVERDIAERAAHRTAR